MNIATKIFESITKLRSIGNGMRRLRRSWRPVLAVMVAMGLLVPSPVPAHDDQPGPPPIEVSLDELAITPLQNLDDGVDGDAELFLTVTIDHANHELVAESFEADYDFDLLGTTGFPFDATLYTHQECTPRNQVALKLALAEADNSSKDVLTQVLLSLTRAAVGARFGGPVAIAQTEAAMSVVATAATALNGNDDLGRATFVSPEGSAPGPLSLITNGQDGRAMVQMELKQRTLEDTGQCSDPPPPPGPRPTPEEVAAMVFSPLEEALRRVFELTPEPKVALTVLDPLDDDGDTLFDFVLGISEKDAGLAIEAAIDRGADGILLAAILAFNEAQDLAHSADELLSEDPALAMDLARQAVRKFREAFEFAVTALQRGAGNAFPETPAAQAALPFQLSLTPGVYSTKRGRTPEVLAVVLGAQGQLEDLTVSRLPQGVAAEIERVSARVFKIKLSIGNDVRPRTYMVRVTARRSAGNPRQVIKDLSLIVN